ncbi:TetR/AcrR family transcriptional regulator [Tunturiibacter gelidoferens]|uniref:TetR/AcrR family transcriptional repressor of nem operon n=3 Tax=Tunturiibacter TaxID=3154218 RepID=A0A7Y9T990_9BACT|nr:TetR/AcrR family transcriptional regulator [Edaphobacter lichenicola]MBB5339526.1 TetR/AcrR family transcriptional repressor of nem operon [Edaphobacter lichenicola]NYF51195.1 TetR/AcrR family transcriptional repressor of nem operon [Edaphobacter lichenicola]
MRYPAAETAEKHARILEEASRLFRERGFSGVSVSEIMKATGLTHGPFYNHFDSKEELMAESVLLGFENTLDGLNATEGTAKGRAEYVKRYLSAAHRDAPGTGCTMASLSAEIRHEPQVRGVFTDRLKALIQAVTAHFPWRSRRSARGDAIRMTASMVGAMILARAVEDERFSDEILSEVRKGLV